MLPCTTSSRRSWSTRRSGPPRTIWFAPSRAPAGRRAARDLGRKSMLIDIKVPPLSESVAEATLLAWHKKVGEAVKRDENLIDIETDKVVLELPAPADGVLAKIIKGDGGTVKAGEVIATLDTEGKASASAPAAVPAQVKAAP